MRVENDLFTGSDNNYTNGFEIQWNSAEVGRFDEASYRRRWLEAWSFLPVVGDRGTENYLSLAAGQELHTPTDITLPDPPRDDQPYAGIVFLDSRVATHRGEDTHTWNARLGWVGPGALGEEVQTEFHEIFRGEEPKGWNEQLEDEPVLNVDYNFARRIHRGGDARGAGWDVIPNVGVSAGTYFTGANAGITLRAGSDLPRSYGTYRLRSNYDPSAYTSYTPGSDWRVLTFVGVQGYALGYYLPLDGNAFQSGGRSVEAENLVAAVSTGFAVGRGSFALTFLLTIATDTFETAEENPEFGALTFSWYR